MPDAIPAADVRHLVHLDLKGTIPDEAGLLAWLDWLADLGFVGVVWEYDDRLPWDAWPGTFRPGFDKAAWARVLAHCRGLGLSVTPLIQVFGHLEWLLKHDRYAEYREAGYINLLCPQAAGIQDRLRAWIDEVIALHPDSEVLHLGGDEVFHIGSCPKCRAVADASPVGVMAVFEQHMLPLVEYVRQRGVRPMIWPSMYRQHQQSERLAEVPTDTLLGTCNYATGERIDWLDEARRFGHEAWGGSAIRQGFDPIHSCLAALAPRVANVQRWRRWAPEQGCATVLHTFWGRSRTLMPIYGPWEGWLPSVIAAANDQRWAAGPWGEVVAIVDRGMQSHEFQPALDAAEALSDFQRDDPFERRALAWMKLALRHRHEMWWSVSATQGWQGLRGVERYVGLDPDIIQLKRDERDGMHQRVDAWAQDVRAHFRQHAWSDVDEFLASRADNLRAPAM